MTIATGSRGRAARDIFTDPSRCAELRRVGGRAVRRARRARRVERRVRARARPPTARASPALDPRQRASFVAATDTFARGFMQTFSDMARRYGVYILGSNNQAPFRESTDPAEIAAFADPDLPERPSSVFVATSAAGLQRGLPVGPARRAPRRARAAAQRRRRRTRRCR